MTAPVGDVQDPLPADEEAIRALCRKLWDAWNRRDAEAFAALFDEDGVSIGFDGSQMVGPPEMRSTLSRIFADHPTARYVGKVRDVRMLSADSALLRAVAGMVPPGQTAIKPAVNAIQSFVAVRREAGWRLACYQNTPAQFHGRPDLVEQLTAELQELA